jgi:predicted phage terminase large subunit-like protein
MATTASNGRWKLAPHLALIDEEIRKLVLREVKERVLVVRMPPRHGKSELVSHWTPAWHEANWPNKNVLFASYEAQFASGWGRKARDTFNLATSLAPDVLAGRPSPDRQAASDWGTTAGGYMATAGVGGPATGKGFHLGICDDLIKNAEQAQSEIYREKTWEWFTSTFWTRREPDGVLIVVGTPWHRDDYLARLRTWGEPIREICLPAICEHEDDPLGRELGKALWPWRFDETELESIRVAQGPYYWNALYQQRPSQHERAEWPESYFEDHIWTDSFYGPFELSAMFVDPSKGKDQKRGDYAAIVFVGLKSGKLWVDCWIDRKPATEIVRQAIEHNLRWNPLSTGLEANAWQDLLAPEFDKQCAERQIPPIPIHLVNNVVPKEIRIGRIGPYLARKQIVFNRTRACKLLVNQLKDFPLGDHDDGPDALEGAIRSLDEIARQIHLARMGNGDAAEQLNPV